MSVELKEELLNKRPIRSWKKPIVILLTSIGILAAVIVLFLAIVFAVDFISSKSEQAKIKSYGQLVPVDGKRMNVLIEGKGEETIVLLPGYGTASPVLDFKPLIAELSPFYKVVVVEPFGYGLSDATEKERTTDNIVSEIHEALQQLNIDKYILMGHSITGIYGLEYVDKYPNEVSAFAGIDTSVPTQPGMDVTFPLKKFTFLKQSGLLRLIMNVSGDAYEGLPFDNQTKEQMRMIALKNAYEATLLNELKHLSTNFKEAHPTTFPKDLPIILFIQGNNPPVEGWIPLHEEQVKDSVHGKLIKLDGGHYLHHTQSKEIGKQFRSFMNEMKK
ncbi:alpha/beta hydrolase [Paenibacillus arenosi]|uniref:Alpha/beta hydrolase n=1 Tax=Paenibacillus arenosi TaxID=2774142 RepID=A0ABR9AT49_9BACL|nr:alpha/beta hydrolase [Paenibacillus arenosi]MBD8497290.1 alpha/beta hydrolase [Paenibacillus arenosi]